MCSCSRFRTTASRQTDNRGPIPPTDYVKRNSHREPVCEALPASGRLLVRFAPAKLVPLMGFVQSGYIAFNSSPRRKIIRRVRPPLRVIQSRIFGGELRQSTLVHAGLGTCLP